MQRVDGMRGCDMGRLSRRVLLVSIVVVATWCGAVGAQAQPDGQLTVAFDASIAPTFLDPAETPGIGTPFVFLYAMHDALMKPLPGNDMAPCLAESWKESPDGLAYEFKLRQGLKFHNGDPFTADDVKFSFHRYKGAAAKLLHDRVKSVDVLDPLRVRFVLDKPWPDFLLFYATPATGAAWIVPKKYIEKVGEEGFRRQPVGLGPYRFVRQSPGVELVLEANEQYWRKKPSIKTVVFKGVPDRTTRLAMLKTGEADIGYLMVGVEAATVKADPKLRLAKVIPPAAWWVEFLEQWKPQSPWHDRRVRLPAEAGYPSGFDGGDITPLPPFTTMGEAVAGYLAAVGIRTKQRSMERVTFMESWRAKKLTGVLVTVTAAPGNAAARIEAFVVRSEERRVGKECRSRWS